MKKFHFQRNQLINGMNYELSECVPIKADLHIHSGEDIYDTINYTVYELIDELDYQNFNCFALTLHDHILNDKKLKSINDYSKSKGIFFIPGVEATIQGKHILIYNIKKHDLNDLKRLSHLHNLSMKYYDINRRSTFMIVTSHPFFPDKACIKNEIWNHYDYLNGVEYNSFYINKFNPNKKAVEFQSHKEFISIFGNSDAHQLKQIGNTFTEYYVRDISLDINGSVQTKSDFKELVRISSDSEYEKIMKSMIYYMKFGDRDIYTAPVSYSFLFERLNQIFEFKHPIKSAKKVLDRVINH